jgi:peroxiredoxin (alkyl hydroperoxide reductase subunit C)
MPSGVSTPADWRPGEDVIVPTAGSCGTARDRMDGKEDMDVPGLVLLHQKDRQGDVLETVLKK